MSKNKKTIFLIALFALSIIYVINKSIVPFWRNWKNQSQQIQKHKKELEDFKVLIEQEDKLSNDFSRLNQIIQAEIPEHREESQFLTEIGKVAKKTNVYIETMNPQPYRNFDSFKELSVKIKMDANLGNLIRFLYEMRKSSVVLVVDKLTLNPKSKNSALLKGHLVISTIFLKD